MSRYIYTYFAECGLCGKKWPCRIDFLDDPDVVLVGYEADFEDLPRGLIYFNHNQDECGSTLTLPARLFMDLYEGTVYPDRKNDTDECPEFCLHREELRPCPAECECARIREAVHIVANWRKKKLGTEKKASRNRELRASG